MISIIIPCFNAGISIAQTIKTVQSQTLSDWELIVIDDGSTDTSAEIIQKIAVQDTRIQYFYIKNQGVSNARNYGVKKAKNDLIAFLDSDDLWYPQRLQKLSKLLIDNPTYGVVYSRLDFLTINGKKTGQISTPLKTPLDAVELLTENRVCTSSNIVTRKSVFESVGYFIEEMSFAEDQEWLFRVAFHPNWQVQGSLENLMGYRASDAGLSADLDKMLAGFKAMLVKIKNYAPELVIQHQNHALAIYYRYLSRRALRLKQNKNIAWFYYKSALKSDISVLWTEPKRSIPTLIAALFRRILSDKIGNRLLKLLQIIPKEK